MDEIARAVQRNESYGKVFVPHQLATDDRVTARDLAPIERAETQGDARTRFDVVTRRFEDANAANVCRNAARLEHERFARRDTPCMSVPVTIVPKPGSVKTRSIGR